MQKILNWTLGSFFRTIGRVLVYILIGLLLSYLLKDIKFPKFNIWQVLDVYAETIVPNYIEINDNQFSGYSYIGNSTNNSNVSLNVYISETIDKIDIPYLIVDLCVPSEPYVDRSHSVGNACTNSCFSNLVQKQKISGSCKTNGQTGQIWRVNTSIVKWGLGTQIATLDDTFYVSIPKSGNNYISVYGVYLSDDNNYSETIDYTQNFNNVINNQNQNTQDIVDNQNQNTQDIVDNQNQNTQDIINNQNSNNQAQIDSQKVCTIYNRNSVKETGKYLSYDGNTYNGSTWGITDYIPINQSSIKVLNAYTGTDVSGYCFYNSEKTRISCHRLYTLSSDMSIPTNAYYIRTSIKVSDDRPIFEVCKNGNQATNEKLDDLQSAITDSSSPNLDGLNNSAGWLPAGPVDSILNLPLSLLNNLTVNLSSSCRPVVLPLPYVNKNIELPCLNTIYSQIDGVSTWLNTIGTIASAFILFGYLINLYKYIDDTLTFRENNYIDNWSGV